MEREFIAKIEGRSVDGDAGSILVYRLSDQISMVVTEERNGDAEIILDKEAAVALAEALKKPS